MWGQTRLKGCVTDINEQPLCDEDYPHIRPEDFLAWCDPDPICEYVGSDTI